MVPFFVMKAYWTSRGRAPLIFKLDTGWRLDGLQSRSGCFGEEKNLWTLKEVINIL
jgi:hypothetical protein